MSAPKIVKTEKVHVDVLLVENIRVNRVHDYFARAWRSLMRFVFADEFLLAGLWLQVAEQSAIFFR